MSVMTRSAQSWTTQKTDGRNMPWQAIVCLPVTRRYCVATAKRVIVQLLHRPVFTPF